MRRHLCLALLVVIGLRAHADARRPAHRTAFVGVNVVDVDKPESAALSTQQTVIVVDGIVSARGRAGSVRVPSDAVVIDGAGKS